MGSLRKNKSNPGDASAHTLHVIRSQYLLMFNELFSLLKSYTKSCRIIDHAREVNWWFNEVVSWSSMLIVDLTS